MPLAGTGAICIWNDITPEGRNEFYDWHVNEHMPERAAIPGFLRSRRFIALDPASRPEFFTLYETLDAAVLTGADYLARLNAPTPWTQKATQAFRNTSRALTTVQTSLGPGAGGILATIRFAVPEGLADDAVRLISANLFPRVIAKTGIAGAHLCTTDQQASGSRTAESRDRSDILAAPGWVVLIEGCRKIPVQEATHLFSELADNTLIIGMETGFYQLEYQC
jgi:hypothetical protein